MNPQSFLDEFSVIANAPGGIQRLRKMILQLAVMEKLVKQDPDDEPAKLLVEKINSDRDFL
ncbi:MAG: restriction endonuclease, partial [Proteobacteria bacterium]|nr:restriction endonuclease [Pseudomonadota bacterium]